MKIFRLLLLVLVWLMTLGQGGHGCMPTDQPFGVAPHRLDPAAWDGYWCGSLMEHWCPADDDGCCRVTVNEDHADELLLDGLGDNSFGVYKLRHVPPPQAIDQFDPTGDGFWFVFGWMYCCQESTCERMADDLDGNIGWVLLRKDGEKAVIWTVDMDQMSDAILRFELPGQLIEGDEGWLLGSLLTEAQVHGLLNSRFFELNYKSPSVLLKSSD